MSFWNKERWRKVEKTNFEVLKELCEPVVKYLQENYHPHTSIVITGDRISLEETVVFIPIENGD